MSTHRNKLLIISTAGAWLLAAGAVLADDPSPAMPAAASPAPAASPAAPVAIGDPNAPVVDLGAPVLNQIGAHKALRVAVYEGPGSPGGEHHQPIKDALSKDPNLDVTVVSPEDIQGGKLTGFDVLVQPGGSGGAQGRALGPVGRDAIRAFVKAGGGYVGICGGSYLASDSYDWSLGIINTMVVDRAHWNRGHGPVKIALTSGGKSLLGAAFDTLPIIYWQGPLMAPKNDPNLPPYTELATFQTEIVKNGASPGVMLGTTAIASAPYGEGRVVVFSPHPEKTVGEASLIHHAIVWAAAARLSVASAK